MKTTHCLDCGDELTAENIETTRAKLRNGDTREYWRSVCRLCRLVRQRRSYAQARERERRRHPKLVKFWPQYCRWQREMVAEVREVTQ